MSYLLSNLIGTTLECIAIGSTLYICDIEQKWWLYRLMLWAYRQSYNVTHQFALPDEKIHLVYRAGIRSWMRLATVVMLLEPAFGLLAWYIWGQKIEFKVEFLTAIPHLVGVITGFYLGPVVNYLFQRREKVIDALESLEKDGISGPVQHVKDIAAESFRNIITHGTDSAKTTELPPQESPPEPFDPDAIIRDFGKRRNM